MRETIEHIMDVEKRAAGIIEDARAKASAIVGRSDADAAEQLNLYKEQEHKRYHAAVSEAESAGRLELEKIRSESPVIDADLEEISEKILRRVMKTVFD